ncbi:uncharacterized protein DNG_08277 [Cephalotrichum gorgonifer]|uniref:DJ-1/PfpI domain-containing protein n=1 Tax=Cephalotrichum gorgonifer TaxID=2041049 RepID=A0AAE8N679_9PEZI|nr:uncharacterized protein DNG_08277 [Cephalotrichum gorgonifer]
MSPHPELAIPQRKLQVGVILTGGVTEILDVAPIDMLYSMSKNFLQTFPGDLLPPHFAAQALDIELHWVTEAGKAAPAHLTSNITLLPTDSFETCPRLDIVLMGATTVGYTPNEAELAFVRKSFEECTAFLTICGGVSVPMMAGLLDGKTVTGPRVMLDELRKLSPKTNWVDKRWMRDGKLWTSGTLLNGTDLMRAFCHAVWEDLGDPSLVAYTAQLASWPKRDVDYRDEPWEIQPEVNGPFFR